MKLSTTVPEKIGLWIDNKPLYRIVQEFTLPTSACFKSNLKSLTHLGIETVCKYLGFYYLAKAVSPLPYAQCTSTNDSDIAITMLYVTPSGIYYSANANVGSIATGGYVIIEYTKTADKAVSSNI